MASDAQEVAEDYRLALEDLSSNMRFEISNLTVIARENTEHALAIAQVLQQHILKAPPNKKLPALYVLDSIVKNVGTPYTLYFGRNLFKTFMESYAVVDQNIRRKMEEMLRTWKDPVPGSMDTRPVFSHELVRPIENALMKARAASMPQQGPAAPGRPRSVMPPHRDTPTPPGMRGYTAPGAAGPYPGVPFPQPNGSRPGEAAHGGFAYPGQQPVSGGFADAGWLSAHQGHGGQAPHHFAQHATAQAGMSAPAPFHTGLAGPYGFAGAAAPAGISVETLSNDIQNLIGAMRAEFSHNPHDASIQNRLKALLDLQAVVQRTSLPPDQLELIKSKVTELAAVNMRPSLAMSSAQIVSQQPARATPPQAMAATPAPAAAHAATGLTLDSLLGPGALAALMARQSVAQYPSMANHGDAQQQQQQQQHQMGAAAPVMRSPAPMQMEAQMARPTPPPQQPSSSAPQSAASLLDRLRQAGMLPQANASSNEAVAAPSAPAGVASSTVSSLLPPNIASLLSSTAAMTTPAKEAVAEPPITYPGLDVISLEEQFQLEDVRSLYDELGIPCTQCGRRFRTDVEGKKKKTAHMDWHFRVHQRSTEAERRGTHRSWYVDQQDWVKWREAVDADHVAAPDSTSKHGDGATSGPGAGGGAAAAGPQYMPVPDPSRGINTVCPICQDKFENKWLDTAQEWVWLDAVLVGERAYHASCHAEATRDREGTPDMGVLGKRKAEESLASPRTRVMKTSG